MRNKHVQAAGAGQERISLTSRRYSCCTIDETHVCGAAVVTSQRLITLRIALVWSGCEFTNYCHSLLLRSLSAAHY